MARTEIERTVRPSLLDRLTENDSGFASDPRMTREESERRYRQAVQQASERRYRLSPQEESERQYRLGVQRDVAVLLNTRRTMIPAPDWCPELRRSVYDFGLIDTTSIPVGTKAGRDRLLSAIQDAIARFEPRLTQVRVRLLDAQQLRAPQLRFVVEAVLVMDPGREDVVFDTVLEVASGEYDVRDPGESTSAA